MHASTTAPSESAQRAELYTRNPLAAGEVSAAEAIRTMCRSVGRSDLADGYIARGLKVDQAKRELMDVVLPLPSRSGPTNPLADGLERASVPRLIPPPPKPNEQFVLQPTAATDQPKPRHAARIAEIKLLCAAHGLERLSPLLVGSNLTMDEIADVVDEQFYLVSTGTVGKEQLQFDAYDRVRAQLQAAGRIAG